MQMDNGPKNTVIESTSFCRGEHMKYSSVAKSINLSELNRALFSDIKSKTEGRNKQAAAEGSCS